MESQRDGEVERQIGGEEDRWKYEETQRCRERERVREKRESAIKQRNLSYAC